MDPWAARAKRVRSEAQPPQEAGQGYSMLFFLRQNPLQDLAGRRIIGSDTCNQAAIAVDRASFGEQIRRDSSTTESPWTGSVWLRFNSHSRDRSGSLPS